MLPVALPARVVSRDVRPGRRRLRASIDALESRQLLAGNFDFSAHIDAEIQWLNEHKHEHSYYDKKHDLLARARANFDELILPSTMTSASLNPAAAGYVLKPGPGGLPAYFDRAYLDDLRTTVDVHAGFFDYQQRHAHEYWVDFANARLGGGLLTDGFAQEEVMFVETPELANVAALNAGQKNVIMTRVLNDPQNPDSLESPEGGSPQPWIFNNVQRVLWVHTDTDGKIDGKTFNEADKQLILDHTEYLQAAQTFNVLAIAAPRLPAGSTIDVQAGLPVVDDLFNTAVAGFQFAKDEASRAAGTEVHPWINSGRLGAGAFHNSTDVAYVVQSLAARHVGVNLTLWNYSTADKARLDGLVDQIITRYAQDAATDARYAKVSHILALASDYLKGTPPPPFVTPSIVTARLLMGEPAPTANGRPAPRPQRVGFQFQFNTAMDAGPVANTGVFQLAWVQVRRARGQVQRILHPISIQAASLDGSGTLLTVRTTFPRNRFAQGGQLTLIGRTPGGLRSTSGVFMGHDAVFRITNQAKAITRIG